MIKDKWWTSAIDIKENDYIALSNGSYEKIFEVEYRENIYPIKVYNLTVEDNHNYYIDEDEVLTHNTLLKKNCIKGVSEAGNKQLVNGPYIKNGKPSGRPTLSGKKKVQFQKDVYNSNVDLDGALRDPNTSEVINWKSGQPRKNVVDFGHKSGYSYKDMFNKYKNGYITLNELKEF